MECDELYISFLFPPDDYVSGITVFKRIVENGIPVDVLQSNFKSDIGAELNEYVDEFVENRLIVDIDCRNDWFSCISKFVEKGMDIIDKDYRKIYSRSWLMGNHFLAFEYKLNHPDVFWTSEFSDPLIYDLSNKEKYYKQMIVSDDYVSKINGMIVEFNKRNGTDHPLVEKDSQAYFVCEYLVYLFSDKIIFTNENQRKIMLEQFPVDLKEFVLKKSEIMPHPTLPEKFYHISDVDLDLDGNMINIAYFGSDYYSKRHFESLFYAVESLNHKFKDKLQIHLYISNDRFLEKLIPSDNFVVKKPLDYLDFLNATTKYDVLIVNDVSTKGNYELNPYLPSKLSDYRGSAKDIWALYEDGSSISKENMKYKSCIDDYESCRCELVRILDDYGFGDENFGVNEDYLNKRLTFLNELYEKEYNRNGKLQRKVKKLKKENNNIKSSNSWRITKPLRKLKK